MRLKQWWSLSSARLFACTSRRTTPRSHRELRPSYALTNLVRVPPNLRLETGLRSEALKAAPSRRRAGAGSRSAWGWGV